MNLSPTELERLIVFSAAEFARRNRSLGIRLSHPEAIALITDETMTMARKGLGYSEIRDRAGRILTTDDVLPGVAPMVKQILVELPMEEGTKLLVVFDPIGPGGEPDPHPGPVPGEVIPAQEEHALFPDADTIDLVVVNTGDRDIQVRSQTHFFEVNRALAFDRERAWGRKLAVPSGTGVRFEPGMPVRVSLVPVAGERSVYGNAGLVNGSLDDPAVREHAFAEARRRGYLGEQHDDRRQGESE